MIVGFVLAGYSVVANDAIPTLGTFLSSNAHRPWMAALDIRRRPGGCSCMAISRVTATCPMAGWRDSGDAVFEWWTLIPPLVIVLTRFGIPVGTTFLILIVFNPRGLESMFVKSMIGYAMAIAVGYLVYRLVMRGLEPVYRNLARSAGGLVDGPAVGLDRVPVEHVADPGSGQHRGPSTAIGRARSADRRACRDAGAARLDFFIDAAARSSTSSPPRSTPGMSARRR